MSPPINTPDVSELGGEKLPELGFPGAGPQDFRVYFDEKAHGQVARHAAESPSLEICGVLVGRWQRDAEGPYAMICDSIRADAATSRSGEVTFTHDAWNAINREMDARFAELRIVGWYHSHPSFGIFLSERDVFIQQHFFSNPGQVAYVVDPVGEVEGVFHWRGGKPVLCGHYWVGKRVLASSERGAGEGKSGTRPGDDPRQAEQPRERSAEPITWLGAFRASLPYVLVFLIGYMLAGMRTAWEQRMMLEGAIRHLGLWKTAKFGERDELNKIDRTLEEISAATGKLAGEHVKLAGEDGADVKKRWDVIQLALRQTRWHVQEVSLIYGLSRDESETVWRLQKEAESKRSKAEEKERGAAATDGTSQGKPAAEPAKPQPKPPAPPAAGKSGGAPSVPDKVAAPPKSQSSRETEVKKTP